MKLERLLANDGTCLSASLAGRLNRRRHVRVKYAMKMRLDKSFILFRLSLFLFDFVSASPARSSVCERRKETSISITCIRARGGVCACARRRAAFFKYKRYELFQDHSTVNLKLRFVGLRAKYNRHSCHSIRARRPRAS